MDPTVMRILAIFAHPDDAELLCGGTLALLAQAGHQVRIITASGGDVGSPTLSREAIRSIRQKEAAEAAKVLGCDHQWGGLHDLQIHYCPDQLRLILARVREFSPDIILTHSPDCYMLDHEELSKIVRMAAFSAGIRLFETPGIESLPSTAALYYADALEGIDKFGLPVPAQFWIDINGAFPLRQQALACHASQREWLREHHGIDEYLDANERLAALHGSRAGTAQAEGFRQHLGHGYPTENRLAQLLSDRVIGNAAYQVTPH